MCRQRYIEHSVPQMGDIVLSKNCTVIGWAIGTAFRCKSPLQWCWNTRPSNHNGIIGFDKSNRMAVFESLMKGFEATPYTDYLYEVEHGKCEIKVVRLSGGLSSRQQLDANRWANAHLGTEYDFASYISHIWRVFLRLPPVWNSNSHARFYCTEAVANLYGKCLGVPKFLNYDLIAPIHIEQLVADGELRIIADTVRG